LAAWLSGYRIRLRSSRSGFESLKGVSFSRKKQSSAVVEIALYALFVGFTYVLGKIKALAPPQKKT
jgi:hypothetical protein